MSRRALLGYAAAWLLAAGLAVAAVFVLTHHDQPDTVSVPPVRQTELVQAAGDGGCRLERGERLNPPVDGPAAARPAAPGIYAHPLAAAALVAAIRRGTIVIQYRGSVGGDRLDALKSLQAAVPSGTIVVPNATGMPLELAVTAYRRMLACPRFSLRALDAVQLFRGRFVGSGPDR